VNKRQLIAVAARHTSLTQGQVGEALEAILEAIANALVGDEHVTISGFGRFDVQHYAARSLRRFDGPGHYEVHGHPVPIFRSSNRLRQRLRKDL
jgi:integration host factor subunit beta